MARYMDRLYRTLKSRMDAPEWLEIKDWIEGRLEDIEKAKVEKSNASKGSDRRRELNRFISTMTKEIAQAQEMQANEEKTSRDMLERTAEQLRSALLLSNWLEPQTASKLAFRLVELWFNNCELLSGEVDKVPTKELIPLAYQIAARVGTFDGIDEVLMKMAREQPFDTVPHLFALANGGWVPVSYFRD